MYKVPILIYKILQTINLTYLNNNSIEFIPKTIKPNSDDINSINIITKIQNFVKLNKLYKKKFTTCSNSK